MRHIYESRKITILEKQKKEDRKITNEESKVEIEQGI